MKKTISILFAAALAMSAFAQTNIAVPPTAPNFTPPPPPMSSNVTSVVAQASGQAVLDSVPGLSILAGIPSSTFDHAKFEVFAGLQNTGSQLNNAIDMHYNLHTNFFVTGGVTLGASQHLLSSVSLGGGVRHGWTLWEVYGGLSGGRNFSANVFEGCLFGRVAWKPSSGMALYLEPGIFFDQNTFKGAATAGPPISIKTGIAFAF